jgi:ribose 5-phosphate isomerase B
MSEGHTTHRLAGEHQRCYGGSPVAVPSPQGRFAAAASVLDGQMLQRAQAHGKHPFHVHGSRGIRSSTGHAADGPISADRCWKCVLCLAPGDPLPLPAWRHIGIGAERMRGVALLHTVRVYLGSDHAGFELEGFLVRRLSSLGHDVVDVRPDVFGVGDGYPPSCIVTARRAVAGLGRIGGVVGGLGNGEQISANKVAGCRAALAWSTEIARLARDHHDAQVVGVGTRMHRPAGAAELVEAFVASPLSGGERLACRIRLIADFEAAGDAPPISAG